MDSLFKMSSEINEAFVQQLNKPQLDSSEVAAVDITKKKILEEQEIINLPQQSIELLIAQKIKKLNKKQFFAQTLVEFLEEISQPTVLEHPDSAVLKDLEDQFKKNIPQNTLLTSIPQNDLVLPIEEEELPKEIGVKKDGSKKLSQKYIQQAYKRLDRKKPKQQREKIKVEADQLFKVLRDQLNLDDLYNDLQKKHPSGGVFTPWIQRQPSALYKSDRSVYDPDSWQGVNSYNLSLDTSSIIKLTATSNDFRIQQKADQTRGFRKLKDASQSFSKKKIPLEDYAWIDKVDLKKSLESLQVHQALENSPGKVLMSCGPDFMDNNFEVAFVYSQSKTEFKLEKKDMFTNQQNLFDICCFTTRIKEIEIPQGQTETFETPFCQSSVVRLKPKTNFTNISSLTVRLDTELYALEFIDKLTGRKSFYASPKEAKSENVKKNTFIETGSLQANLSTLLKNSRELSIVVFPNYMQKHQDISSVRDEGFIFTNVKFLGNDSDIQLSVSNAKNFEVVLPFCFNFCFFYKPQKNPT